MQNHTLTALLLDPFLTFGEAEKEFGAMPTATRATTSDSLKPKAPSSAPRMPRRPSRVSEQGLSVAHHLPATAG